MNPQLELLGSPDSKGRSRFRLTGEYQYELGPGSVVTIPAGFVTNFGTIPRCVAWYISPAQLGVAALVHDYLCNEDLDEDETPVESGYSRWLADSVLYEAMARMGFPWRKRFAVFVAVRIAGILTGQNKWAAPPEVLPVQKPAEKVDGNEQKPAEKVDGNERDVRGGAES